MNATGVTQPMRLWPESARWAVCFMLAVAFHVAGAAALLARWNNNDDLVANAPVITIELAALPVPPKPHRAKSRRDRSSRKPSRNPSPKSRLKRNWSCRRIRRLSRCRPLYRRPKSRSRPRKSPSRSTQAFRARPALPRQDLNARRHQCPGPIRTTRMQCRTGSRS